MLTDYQRTIFSKILDLNMEFKQETNFLMKVAIRQEYDKKMDELRLRMGDEEFNKFMRMGSQMFAPKQG